MGRFGDDRSVMEFAMAYEKLTGHLEKQPEPIASE